MKNSNRSSLVSQLILILVTVHAAFAHAGPVIMQPPFSQTRIEGQPVSFGVRAEGIAPITYRWLRDGIPIPGATTTNCSVTATQAAAFSVVISDASSGSVTSAPARLTILPRPSGPGSLDVTFDPTAMNQLSGLTEGDGTVYCLARQSDGKMILGGNFAAVNDRPRRGIARLNPDGTMDESFNPGYGVDGAVQRVAVLPDGKVLIAGSFSNVNGSQRDGIARLHSDGTVDACFRPAIQIDQTAGLAATLCVQSDGKILIGGRFTRVCGMIRLGLARLNSDGTLDTSFDAGSVVDVPSVSEIAVQADGRILIAGHFTASAYNRPLARLMPDGSADPDFNVPTIEETSIGWVHSVALDADGGILIGGRFWSVNGTARTNVARLLPDGALDGAYVPPVLDRDVYKLAVVAGKTVIGGIFTSVDGVARRGLARLNADGSLDSGFDAGAAISVGSDSLPWETLPWVNDMLVATNGVFVAAGLADVYYLTSPHPLLRLLPDGSVDQHYLIPEIAGEDRVCIQAVQPDGKVLALLEGKPSVNGTACGPLVRLMPDGTLDTSFHRAVQSGRLNCVAVQPDGKILVGGEHFILPDGTFIRGLIRLNSDGTLDTGFVTEPDGEYGVVVSTVTLQPDGRILVAGEFYTIRDGLRRNIARLNADGTLDDSFTLDPSLAVIVGEYSSPLRIVQVQPDGRILLGGYFNDVEARLVRLMPDGSLDRELIGPEIASSVGDVARQPDGKLLVCGQFQFGDPEKAWTIIRITTDGDIETVFDGAFSHITGFAMQPDGKVLVGAGGEPEAVVRFLPDGTRDISFVPNVRYRSDAAQVSNLLLQPDGQILAVVSLTTVNGIPWSGIVRLNNDVERPWVTRQLPGQHAPAGLTVRLVAQPAGWVEAYAVQDRPPTHWIVTNVSHGGVFDPVTGKVKFGPYFDNTVRTLTYDVFPPLGYTGVGHFTGDASADGISMVIAGDSAWVLAAPHPADINRDWRLIMDEVTAYGAAWRTGGIWRCEPGPIPMSYVTRAAALWRGGETYVVDPGVVEPPLWWVNEVGLGVLQRSEATTVASGTATRQLPEGFLAGDPVEVAITVRPAGAAAYALEENLPAGARLVGVLDGGAFDVTAGKVKWGPFLDGAERVLRYRVALNQPEGGTLHFSGEVSFDGQLAATDGRTRSGSTSLLNWNVRPGETGRSLQLRGDLTAVYDLQSSEDLAQWTTIGRVTNMTGTVEIPLPVNDGSPRSFYRAKRVAP
ncbi:MAG TPA: hypothetical protein VK327_03600 [Candidatus Paceibacterota bacterium]|nr:hypothetical protein [Candidatus Paceibacterota bacterium]